VHAVQLVSHSAQLPISSPFKLTCFRSWDLAVSRRSWIMRAWIVSNSSAARLLTGVSLEMLKTYDLEVEVRGRYTMRVQAVDDVAARDLARAFLDKPRELSSVVQVTGRRPFDVISLGMPVEVE